MSLPNEVVNDDSRDRKINLIKTHIKKCLEAEALEREHLSTLIQAYMGADYEVIGNLISDILRAK